MRNAPYASENDLIDGLSKYGVFVGEDIHAAIVQADMSHKHQLREYENGSYRHQHLFPVTLDVAKFYSEQLKTPATKETIIGSILHDSVEDDPNMSLDLLANFFGNEVHDIVKPLTKDKARQTSSAQSDWDMRKLVEQKSLYQLTDAPMSSRIIKGFDRLNNITCLPVKNRDKSKRIYRMTKEVFMPWLQDTEPLIYPMLSEELDILENKFKAESQATPNVTKMLIVYYTNQTTQSQGSLEKTA